MVKIPATFDPIEVVNSTTIPIAFRRIKEEKGSCVLMGDGRRVICWLQLHAGDGI